VLKTCPFYIYIFLNFKFLNILFYFKKIPLRPTTGVKRKKNAWSLEEKRAFCFSKHPPLGTDKIDVKETIHSLCEPITI
jgi:hypothetical protein